MVDIIHNGVSLYLYESIISFILWNKLYIEVPFELTILIIFKP